MLLLITSTLEMSEEALLLYPSHQRVDEAAMLLPFSLGVPIQLAVGPQSPERLCCNISMIIIAVIIRKVPVALTGWILLFSLRGKRCKVKNQSLSVESTRGHSLENNPGQSEVHRSIVRLYEVMFSGWEGADGQTRVLLFMLSTYKIRESTGQFKKCNLWGKGLLLAGSESHNKLLFVIPHILPKNNQSPVHAYISPRQWWCRVEALVRGLVSRWRVLWQNQCAWS